MIKTQVPVDTDSCQQIIESRKTSRGDPTQKFRKKLAHGQLRSSKGLLC